MLVQKNTLLKELRDPREWHIDRTSFKMQNAHLIFSRSLDGTKNIFTFFSSPIKHESQVYEHPVHMILCHTKALLQRRIIDDVSEGNIPTQYQARIKLQYNSDELEVKRCLLHVPCLAPRADGILVGILREL